jgi:hypothetical protein
MIIILTKYKMQGRKYFFFILTFPIILSLDNIRKQDYTAGIYYNIPQEFLINSISGTGDRLKDVIYRQLCKYENCNTDCCEGNINEMYCGDYISCIKYREYHKKTSGVNIWLFIFIIYCFLLSIFIPLILLKWGNGKKCRIFKFIFIWTLGLPIQIFVILAISFNRLRKNELIARRLLNLISYERVETESENENEAEIQESKIHESIGKSRQILNVSK